MPFVVTENCIRCQYMDCVAACPVDCFREGDAMLVIHPNECIDCGVCEPVCPAKAIIPDTHPDAGVWPNINARYAAEWPAITEQRPHAADADSWRNRPGKYELVFGVKPIS